MTTTEVTRVEARMPSRSEIEDLTTLGNVLGKSGFFKDVQSGYQAVAKLMFGRDLGLSATAAMTGVHIIEGKPEISANLQAQMVRTYTGPEGERYRYLVRELDNQHCKIEFFQRERGGQWESLGYSEYTMRDAQTAQLAGKGNWKKHPRNMLWARAMSDGVNFHCPEVTNGIRTYHEGEIDVNGAARDGASTPVAPFEPASASDVIDGQAIDEPHAPAPALVGISDDDVKGLRFVLDESGAGEKWLRMQLIAVGLEDVPEGPVSDETLGRLTVEQAREFMSVLNARVDAQQEAGAK